MAEQKTPADPNIPLPDPARVQRTFDTAVRRFQERRATYTGLAIVALLVAVGVIFALNLAPDRDEHAFAPLWRRCQAVRVKLAIDTSAGPELADLAAYVDKIRGAKEEGLGLWFLAVYHYREAWTPDKATFDDREVHLDKAIACLMLLLLEASYSWQLKSAKIMNFSDLNRDKRSWQMM